MPSKMDCKEMRLTRFCRFWPPFAWFLAHFLCHVKRSGHLRPLPREPPIDRAWAWPQWCFGKGAEYPWGGALLRSECVENFTMDSPWPGCVWQASKCFLQRGVLPAFAVLSYCFPSIVEDWGYCVWERFGREVVCLHHEMHTWHELTSCSNHRSVSCQLSVSTILFDHPCFLSDARWVFNVCPIEVEGTSTDDSASIDLWWTLGCTVGRCPTRASSMAWELPLYQSNGGLWSQDGGPNLYRISRYELISWNGGSLLSCLTCPFQFILIYNTVESECGVTGWVKILLHILHSALIWLLPRQTDGMHTPCSRWRTEASIWFRQVHSHGIWWLITKNLSRPSKAVNPP